MVVFSDPPEPFDISMLVPHNYTMNPETDEIVPSGFELLNGMSVLIEDNSQRQALTHINGVIGDLGMYNKALTRNRWCEVTHLKIWDNKFVTFVGVYDDGVKIQRKHEVWWAWLVWIDSLPEVRDESMEPEYITTGENAHDPQKKAEVLKNYRKATEQYGVSVDEFKDHHNLKETAQKLMESWLTPKRPFDDYELPPYVHGPATAEQYQKYTDSFKSHTKAPEVPGNVDIVQPTGLRWYDLAVDEIDDLVRWKNSRLGSRFDLEMIRDEFELPLRSGRYMSGANLRELFRKEFERKSAFPAMRSWTDFDDEEISKIIEIDGRKETFEDDAVIVLSSKTTVSGAEFKQLFDEPRR